VEGLGEARAMVRLLLPLLLERARAMVRLLLPLLLERAGVRLRKKPNLLSLMNSG
jgi:hypothetical protein